jgi:hypothetical protein
MLWWKPESSLSFSCWDVKKTNENYQVVDQFWRPLYIQRIFFSVLCICSAERERNASYLESEFVRMNLQEIFIFHSTIRKSSFLENSIFQEGNISSHWNFYDILRTMRLIYGKNFRSKLRHSEWNIAVGFSNYFGFFSILRIFSRFKSKKIRFSPFVESPW